MAKMTMKDYEGSEADKRADRSSKHGSEGSAKDKATDREAVNKANSAKGWHGFSLNKK